MFGADDDERPSLILYADIASPLFSEFHKSLSQRAREGEFSYRVRYRPDTASGSSQPLFVSGYGVELSLKRTDYIVIDDRDAEEEKSASDTKPTLADSDAKESPTADLKPLSSSEVSKLGMNAASFVMNSDDPFETLSKLSQDFPRHSSAIAGFNATAVFLQEYEENVEKGMPEGLNAMWINGVQIHPRHVDAFSLLTHLRHERKIISSFADIGLSADETIKLLSDPVVANAQTMEGVQRFDYRDDKEGSNVIIWLNNLEKDGRYDGWPAHVTAVRYTIALIQFYKCAYVLLFSCSNQCTQANSTRSAAIYTTSSYRWILRMQRTLKYLLNVSTHLFSGGYPSDLVWFQRSAARRR